MHKDMMKYRLGTVSNRSQHEGQRVVNMFYWIQTLASAVVRNIWSAIRFPFFLLLFIFIITSETTVSQNITQICCRRPENGLSPSMNEAKDMKWQERMFNSHFIFN